MKFHGSALPHQALPQGRFDGANEHGFANAVSLADRVDTKMIAIDQIHVSVSRMPEHGSIPFRLSAECVACRIVLEIGFRFDNGPTAYTIGCAPNQPMAKQ